MKVIRAWENYSARVKAVDSLTHALMGASLAVLGQKRTAESRGMLTVTILASELPDLDLLPGLLNPQAQLVYHRAYSHSWTGLALAAGLLTLASGVLAPHLPRKRVLAWAALAILLHLAFDTLTTYGTGLFIPFAARPLALDVLFGVDIPLLILLGGGCSLYFWRGERRVLSAAVVLALLYTAGRWGVHWRLTALAGGQLPGTSFSVLPGPVLRWTVVADKGDAYAVGSIDPISGKIQFQTAYPKNLKHPLVAAIRRSPIIESYLQVARYPWAQISREPDGWRVKFSDLRLWPFDGFNAVAYLDENANMRSVKIGPKK